MRDTRHVTGTELRQLFDRYTPFTPTLALKSESERRTVLAVNGNFPFELELAGFYHASTLDGGSPLIVQFSSGALATAGRGLEAKADLVESLRAGARLAARVADSYASIYEPPFVALGLTTTPFLICATLCLRTTAGTARYLVLLRRKSGRASGSRRGSEVVRSESPNARRYGRVGDVPLLSRVPRGRCRIYGCYRRDEARLGHDRYGGVAGSLNFRHQGDRIGG